MTNPSVFISHASKDDRFVKALRQELEPQGVKIWADSRELLPGDELELEIQRAISNSQFFFLIVSGNTFQSKWVKKELDFAKNQRKRIVTLLLEIYTLSLHDALPICLGLAVR